MSSLELLIQHTPQIRLFFFLGILLIMTLWELILPCRRLIASKPRRWLHNILMTVLNTLFLRLAFPILAVGWAQKMNTLHWGLFHHILLPEWVSVVFTIILLDMVIYFQHRFFHRFGLLWRLHQVHHVDLDIDVSTALRFHPLEIILSMLIKFSAIALLGAQPAGVVIFEILLNGMSMFNHGNVRMLSGIDLGLRFLVVTPDMHRVHHSIILQESNHNFGFCLAWWDRLFATYQAQPSHGHQNMQIGLLNHREERALTFWQLLKMPFSH